MAVYEGDQYDFDVVACGWASGDADADRPLGPTPDDRRLFQLVGVGRDVAVTVQAAAPNGTWLYVMAADSGPDEVVVGREGDRTGADATGDLIDRDGDRLTSSGPIMLSDRVDDSPAETVTLDVSCA